jgi:DNA-binding response OmpR family regulator
MTNTSLPPILVVDDNPDNAHIIRDYLGARGYPITVAYNGDDALKAFEEVKPALVLLDVMMPGRDGWQVCREMKQHPTLGRSVRIVMVTALDDWVNKRQALQTGADDFVEKPFELSKLVATVERNMKLFAPAAAAAATGASPAKSSR